MDNGDSIYMEGVNPRENIYEGMDIGIILDNMKIENYIIRKLELSEGINRHHELKIEMEIAESLKKKMEEIGIKEEAGIIIEVGLKNDKGSTDEKKEIFKGVIQYFEVLEYGSGGCRILIEGLSRSIFFDRLQERKYRVFQDRGLTYADIVEEINKDYKDRGIKIEYFEKAKVPIGRLIVQFNETDWEFLVRIASHLNTGLLVTEQGLVTFGIIDIGDRKVEERLFSDYSVVRDYKNTYYKLYSGKVVSSGDKVSLIMGNYSEGNDGKDKKKPQKTDLERGSLDMRKSDGRDALTLTVLKSRIFLDGYLLRSEFLVADIDNYRIMKKYNDRIRGCTIEVKVEKVYSEDDIAKMEVSFSEGLNRIIEEKGEADLSRAYGDYGIKRFPLSYQTFYSQTNTGFFCTPEVNDTVEVYFPNEDENFARVSWAINNKGNGRFSNYEKRNFHINGDDFNFIVDKDSMELNMEKSYTRISRTSNETAESFVNKGLKNLVVISDDYLGIEAIGETDLYGNSVNIVGKERDIRIETPAEIRIKGRKVHNN